MFVFGLCLLVMVFVLVCLSVCFHSLRRNNSEEGDNDSSGQHKAKHDAQQK